MMAFTRAEREGDWSLHLYVVEKMVPDFFATGHFYLCSLQRLHPDILKKVMVGDHVMHHQHGLWNGLWSDQFIETTCMCCGHGPSGIISSTLNEFTLAIWAFSHSTLTQVSNDMETLKERKLMQLSLHTKKNANLESRMMLPTGLKFKRGCRFALIFSIPANNLKQDLSGRVIDDPTANVHEAVEIGAEEQLAFEGEWPASFHRKLKRRVKNIASAVMS